MLQTSFASANILSVYNSLGKTIHILINMGPLKEVYFPPTKYNQTAKFTATDHHGCQKYKYIHQSVWEIHGRSILL